jgi:alpha-amylase
LIWVHEHLADGPSLQRWKDLGVFAYERLGGGHLLVGLNKDANSAREIRVQTGFPPHTQLHDFAGHAGTIMTDEASIVTLTIPQNANGRGYVCYARPTRMEPFAVKAIATTQEYEGASDLDIKPAVENDSVLVCRVFADAQEDIESEFFFDTSNWIQNTSIQLQLEKPDGAVAVQRVYESSTPQGSTLSLKTQQRGFHTFRVRSANTPAENKAPSYKLRVKYVAPQTV